MTHDPFAAERKAVNIAESLNALLDLDVPEEVVRRVLDSPELPQRRLIMSLVPRLWPDENCTDGC